MLKGLRRNAEEALPCLSVAPVVDLIRGLRLVLDDPIEMKTGTARELLLRPEQPTFLFSVELFLLCMGRIVEIIVIMRNPLLFPRERTAAFRRADASRLDIGISMRNSMTKKDVSTTYPWLNFLPKGHRDLMVKILTTGASGVPDRETWLFDSDLADALGITVLGLRRMVNALRRQYKGLYGPVRMTTGEICAPKDMLDMLQAQIFRRDKGGVAVQSTYFVHNHRSTRRNRKTKILSHAYPTPTTRHRSVPATDPNQEELKFLGISEEFGYKPNQEVPVLVSPTGSDESQPPARLVVVESYTLPKWDIRIPQDLKRVGSGMMFPSDALYPQLELERQPSDDGSKTRVWVARLTVQAYGRAGSNICVVVEGTPCRKMEVAIAAVEDEAIRAGLVTPRN